MGKTKLNLSESFPITYEARGLILPQYSTTLKTIKVEEAKTRKLELGICLQILKSIHRHFNSLETLIEQCYIESSGSVTASLWEKAITLQFILLKPTKRSEKYAKHDSFRRFPWPIKKMVKEIVKSEGRKKKEEQRNIELLYLQYSFLCAVKHGNPYTLAYLNRHTESENLFLPEPYVSEEDIPVLKWLYLISISTILDTLISFSSSFCNSEQLKSLLRLSIRLETEFMPQIEAKMPVLIRASSNDFKSDFLEYLKGLEIKAKGYA